MFFLGSINSAIPYIVYLSVIWAFMLIGISGGIHFFRSADQVTQEHHISIHQHYSVDDSAHFNSYQNTANKWFECTSNNNYTRFGIVIRKLNSPILSIRSVRGYTSPVIPRGPPVIFC